MKFVPLPHQPRMIDWLFANPFAALYVGCGLGKTVVVLFYLADLILSGRSKGALIIAPLRVARATWPIQIAQWDHSSWLKVADLRTPEGLRAWDEGSCDIYIINYDMLASREVKRNGKTKRYPGVMEKCFKGRKELPVDTVIFDELDFITDSSSSRFKSVAPYCHLFERRVGLTGTPLGNSYLNLFGPIKAIDLGERLGVSYHGYKNRWFESDFMGYKFTLRSGAKDQILAKISDIALVMQSEDYLDVPTTHAIEIRVNLPAEAMKAYKTMEKELLLEWNGSEIVSPAAATLFGKLRQITGGAVLDADRNVVHIHDAKLDALKKLRADLGTEPLLVFVEYIHEREAVLAAIPGSVMFDERLIDDWVAGKIHTFVANCASMAHGVDRLQLAGSKAVWLTLTTSGRRYHQANSRLIRTGQSSETTIYRILANVPSDDAAAEALRSQSDEQAGLLTALKNLQKLSTP